MFDIDGTLTVSSKADTQCFTAAMCKVLGLDAVEGDWTFYRHVTDTGIVAEVVERRCGRACADADQVSIRDQFVRNLQDRFVHEPCHPVSGAAAMIERLLATPNTRLALATGGWEQSARLKLKTAGLNVEGIPFASANDAIEREEIMKIAYARAAKACGVESFDTWTYVGDGIWDLRACQKLGISFIGIGAEGKADILRREGAKWIVDAYDDTFLAYLHQAQQFPAAGVEPARPLRNNGF